jgi:signal transduction histidine kinase
VTLSTSRQTARIDAAMAAQQALDALTAQQAELITLLDRSSALRAVGERTRDRAGVDVALVGQLEPNNRLVLRHTAGTRTPCLSDLVVPSGLGLGGQVLATGRPAWVHDYVTSPTITHHFEVVAVLYAGARTSAWFGDTAIDIVLDVAAEASRALEVCRRVEGHTSAALTADRQRLSVALHDSVGAMLFGIGAEVRDLRSAAGGNVQLARRLRAIETQVSAAASALRESLAALSPAVPEQELSATIVGDCEAFGARTGILARAIVLGELPPLDRHRAELLRQVAREGLLNVEKHARATSVLVSLSRSEQGVMVAVVDDGIGLREVSGCPRPHSSGLGLASLRDRLGQVGGSLSLVDTEDGGLTLRAWCPCG